MCLDLFLLLPLSLLLLLMWLSALHSVYTQHHNGLDNRRIVLAKYSSLSWYPSLLITDQVFTTQKSVSPQNQCAWQFFPPLMRPSLFFPFFARPCHFNYSFSKIFHTFRSFLCEGCKRKPPCDFPAHCRPDWSGEGLKSRGQQLAEACSLQSLSSLMAFPWGGAGSMTCGLIKNPGNGTNIISLFILKSTKSVVFIIEKVCDGFHN